MTATNNSTVRVGAYTAIGGAVIMLIGAVLLGTSGTDLWTALTTGDMAEYLKAVAGVKTQLIANLTLWIIGVITLGLSGAIMADLGKEKWLLSQVALLCYRVAVPIVVMSYLMMLALIMQISPDVSATSISIAHVVGWIGVRADDISTALMIGVGPMFIALAGRGKWAPSWLLRWSFVTAFLGVFSIVGLYLPELEQFGFLVIPVGVFWMIAAGIALWRHSVKA